MPLSGNEQQQLMRRIADIITNEFGHTSPALPRETLGSPHEGFIAACEQLVMQMGACMQLMHQLLHQTKRDDAPEQPDQPDKPKNKGGRPPKPKGEAAPSAPQGNGQANDPFGDPNEKPQDDPLGVPDQPPQPPQQQPMTDVQVKDALRTYMQAWGTEGTARLTDLLTRVAGVKRFSDLPANKWGAVVQAAQQEMTQAK